MQVHPDGPDGKPDGVASDHAGQPTAEAAPRLSEEHCRQVFEDAPLGIALVGTDQKVQRANRAFCDLLGYTGEELSRLAMPEMAHPDDCEQTACAIAQLIRGNLGPLLLEKRWLRKDGRTVFTRLTCECVCSPQGAVVGVLGMMEDITEQKRLEESLRCTQEHLHDAIEAAGDGLWERNLKTGDLHLSPQWATLLDFPAGESQRGMDVWLSRVHPADLDAILRSVSDHLAGRAPIYAAEYRIRTASNDYVWISDRGRIVERDAQGVPVRLAGSLSDITSRKHEEEAHRASEERFRIAAENASDVIYEWDLATGIGSYFGKAWNRYGILQDALPKTAEECLKLLHPADRDPMVSAFERHLRTNEPFRQEFRIVAPDGQLLSFSTRGTAVRDIHGVPVRFVGVAADITDRRLAERQLQRSNDQLRQLAARLEEVREQERARIAREIHDELGQMLTGLKLDLHGLAVRYSREQRDSNHLKRALRPLLKTIDRTIDTVRRISSDLRPGILDDLGLIAAMEWQMNEFQARTGIRCAFKAASPEIGLDRERSTVLFRILQELLTNVVRHAGARSVTAELRQTRQGVALEVADDGRGITKEQISDRNSLGILGIEERAQSLGGVFHISGDRGRGTLAVIEIPRLVTKRC